MYRSRRWLAVAAAVLLVGTLEQGVMPVPLRTAAARPLDTTPDIILSESFDQ